MVDLFFQKIEWQGASKENGVVEGADVKAGSEGAFSTSSELADFKLTDLVG